MTKSAIVFAVALHTIMRGGVAIPASTATKTTVFETDEDEFKKLDAVTAARRATKDEITIYKSNAGTSVDVDDSEDDAARKAAEDAARKAAAEDDAAKKAAEDAARKVAAKDPNGKPKGKEDDI